MKSSREKILYTLLSRQRATINELAEVVGINGISVRHHLVKLQAEGLIAAEEQRHGVGRPRFVYHLTKQGLEKFPTNFLRFVELLLSKLQDVLTPKQLSEVYESIGKEQADSLRSVLEGSTLNDQIKSLSDELGYLGYRLDTQKDGDDLLLRNQNCPYRQIAVSNPEICRVDETMFTELLGRPVSHESCIAKSDPACIYRIKAEDVN
jgi:DeoR family suf operon transcriptional repressor